MNESALSVIATILSIGAIIAPVMFGFILWKMSQVFVTKDEFSNYKSIVDSDFASNKKLLEKIQDDISELLQRTAAARK